MTSIPSRPGLRRNLTLLCVYHALMMSLFPMAIITLYQQHELGLSMTEIMGLQAIFGVALATIYGSRPRVLHHGDEEPDG